MLFMDNFRKKDASKSGVAELGKLSGWRNEIKITYLKKMTSFKIFIN